MKDKKIEDGYAPNNKYLLDEAGVFPKSDIINLWQDIPKENRGVISSKGTIEGAMFTLKDSTKQFVEYTGDKEQLYKDIFEDEN